MVWHCNQFIHSIGMFGVSAVYGLVQVVAVPFNTGFNHTRIADEAQYKFERCLQALALRPDTAEAPTLPVYGMGHSLGSLVQLLISVRYASQRAGNVLISFNNKPMDDVPLIAPFLGPASRVAGPFLSQVLALGSCNLLVHSCQDVCCSIVSRL